MRYKVGFCVFMLVCGFMTGQVKFELSQPTPIILGEPAYINMVIVNQCEKTVALDVKRINWIVAGPDGKRTCVRPQDFVDVVGDPNWRNVAKLEKGERWKDGRFINTFFCPFWTSGTYKIKAEYKPVEPLQDEPHWYEPYGGIHALWLKREISNEVSLEVKDPEGIDKQAAEFIYRCVTSEQFPAHRVKAKYAEKGITKFYGFLPYALRFHEAGFDAIKSKILETFPSSTYAGWVVAPFLGKFDKADPKQIFTLIKNKKYNPWNSVPYPGTKDGWKGLGGEELAKWQNEWILKILKDHPEFAWHDRLQLTLAVNYYYLGRDKEAESILKSLGTGRRSSPGGWAERFLNLVKAEKMRKHTLDSLPTVGK